LLAWGVSGCGEPPRPDVATSIVVFVSLDTARADHFGFLGNGRIRTPRLDALARESIVFDDYMTVSRACILTITGPRATASE
jgi:glucan phosphoethanolaminetransferase (alkaline phosphatase superfamily)